jgi:hypothetical protein
VAEHDYPYLHEHEPLEERGPLPRAPDKDLQNYFPAG